jgi:hypothetical protein
MTIRANWGRLAAITGAAVPALNILTAFHRIRSIDSIFRRACMAHKWVLDCAELLQDRTLHCEG